jgi:hypothetical protein
MKEIPLLQADDIDVRIQSFKNNAVVLLLYKDARVDMRILDEVFGPLGWQRTHEVIAGNLFCNIDIWDEQNKCWIRKQDVGKESNKDAEKGQASDSFKRASTNVGIGRELYTSPFIYVKLNADEIDSQRNKPKSSVKFTVKAISYNERKEINHLIIVDGKGKARFESGKRIEEPQPSNEPIAPPKPKPKVIKAGGTTKLLTQKGYISLEAIDKETLQKMYDSGFYKEADAEIEKLLG